MPKKKIKIDYTARDFDSIKRNLIDHASIYYPDSFKDFSENSFGSYILDSVAYVGDMLSFYLDYQVNESFLETALEYENVRKLSRNEGYKFTAGPSVMATATFYIIVPANTSGLGPQSDLIPVLKKGSEFSTFNKQTFVLTEDVDFANVQNEIVAARFSNSTGKPTSYAIKAHGNVKSTVLFRTEINIGAHQKFLRVRIGPPSISEIRTVRDSEGHEYYEVENLSQDVIYVNTTNKNAKADGVPNTIKPKIVPRRFVLVQDQTGTYLQFGHGISDDSSVEDFLDPSQATLRMSGRNYIIDSAFDPSSLIQNKSLGIAPSNTKLTIFYYKNEQQEINVAVGALNKVVLNGMEFPRTIGNTASELLVKGSLEVANEESISGNTSEPTSEELRYMTYSSKAAQMRAVTKNDYETFVYTMPSSLGTIKRATVVNDPSVTNRRMSLYVVSQDSNGYLKQTNLVTKNNLKVWLNKNKMVNDQIDIYDAKIHNLGLSYEIIVDPTRDKFEVLNVVNARLVEKFQEKMYVGEAFYITDVYNLINKTPGVTDTTFVTVLDKFGEAYSTTSLTAESMKSKDGTYIKAPRNVIFEIKYPAQDIQGAAI